MVTCFSLCYNSAQWYFLRHVIFDYETRNSLDRTVSCSISIPLSARQISADKTKTTGRRSSQILHYRNFDYINIDFMTIFSFSSIIARLVTYVFHLLKNFRVMSKFFPSLSSKSELRRGMKALENDILFGYTNCDTHEINRHIKFNFQVQIK